MVALAVLAGCAWTLVAGKDLSWDLINHHLYQPFALFSGRFATDLFAAGNQSYYNPLGYVPFYGLAMSPLPGWAVGLSLAALHGLSAWPLTILAQRLWPLASDHLSRWIAVALALVAPIYLLTIGTSSADPWSTLQLLSALALVLGVDGPARRAVLAGLLVGFACGMKPSNAIFAVALGFVFLVRLLRRQDKALTLGLAFCAAALVGAAVATGAWSAWRWSTFGNPVFPLFNQWFLSPFAPIEPMVDSRFALQAWHEVLTRPFAIAEFRTYTHTETFAPDLRPLVLLLLGTAAAVWSRLRGTSGEPSAVDAGPSRAAFELSVFLGLSYLLWLLSGANSRYAITLFVLVGPALMLAARALFSRSGANAILAVLLVLQCAYYGHDGQRRYWAASWGSGPYLDVRVPVRLREEPVLHVSLTTPSYAGVAPFLHPGGAFINAMGPMSLPTNGPLGDALRTRFDKWRGHTRILLAAPRNWQRLLGDDGFRLRADRIVYRLGLKFDWRDCLEIQIMRQTAEDPGADPARLLSCRAAARVTDDPDYARDLAIAERAFDVIEQQCPKVFGPRPMVTDSDQEDWQRRYMNTASRATVSLTEGVSVSHFRSPKVVWLGSVNDVVAGRGKPACQGWKELELQ